MRPALQVERMPTRRAERHGLLDVFSTIFRILCCLGGVERYVDGCHQVHHRTPSHRPLDALDSSTTATNTLLHYQAPTPAIVQDAEPDTPSSATHEHQRLLPKGHTPSSAAPHATTERDAKPLKGAPSPAKLANELEAQRTRVREKLGAGLSRVDLDEDVCPTCLEPYTEENPRITTSCGHHFHLACIYEWLERSQTCPMCGTSMQFSELL